jgi:solute carrier family 25 iron transporter 28/37
MNNDSSTNSSTKNNNNNNYNMNVDLLECDWDGRTPFWTHCVAGSLAGVIEHAAVYPLDTVRTHIQVACAACAQQQQVQCVANNNNTLNGGVNAVNNNVKCSTSSTNPSLLRPTTTSAASAARNTLGAPISQLLAQTTATTTLNNHTTITATSNTTNIPVTIRETLRYLLQPQSSVLSTTTNSNASATSVTVSHTTTNATMTTTTSYTSTIRNQLRAAARLWRGAQTVVVGCIPAHALYFSSYELVLNSSVVPYTATVAGAVAAFGHDLVLTPLDTMKQRIQLGQFSTMKQAYQGLSFKSLYKSFPITLVTNVPYGMLLVTTNEACKRELRRNRTTTNNLLYLQNDWHVVLVSSGVAGLVASALTTPLDRVKTALQTQAYVPPCWKQQQQQLEVAVASTSDSCPLQQLRHKNWIEAARHLYATEGARAFTRGMLPRMAQHVPAVAISWTTYEAAKQYLCS